MNIWIICVVPDIRAIRVLEYWVGGVSEGGYGGQDQWAVVPVKEGSRGRSIFD